MDSQETAVDSYSTSTRHFSHGVRNPKKEPTKGGHTPQAHKPHSPESDKLPLPHSISTQTITYRNLQQRNPAAAKKQDKE